MDNKENIIVFCITIIIVVITLTSYYMSLNSCNEQGGKLVRGMLWYECVVGTAGCPGGCE